MHKTKKTLLLIIIIAIILIEGFLIFKTQFIQPDSQQIAQNFLIKYTSDASFDRIKTRITIHKNGIFEYNETSYWNNKTIQYFLGKLFASELDELNNVIKNNDFSNLPTDLTNKEGKCFDAATVYIEVQSDGKIHKAGGYCVINSAFNNVQQKLFEYYKKFKTGSGA